MDTPSKLSVRRKAAALARARPTLRTQEAVFFFQFSFFFQPFPERERHDGVIYPGIPAGVWVILPPLQLRTHHIGKAPGPAGASPHLPKLPAGAEEAGGRGVLCD